MGLVLLIFFVFFIALTTDNKLYSYGCNDKGQLGLGDTEKRWNPTLVKDLLNVKIKHISCGNAHAGIVTGNVWYAFPNSTSFFTKSMKFSLY